VDEVPLEAVVRGSGVPCPLGRSKGRERGCQRGLRIPTAMLPELRDLHPRERPEEAAPIREHEPLRLGLGEPFQATEQPRPIRHETIDRPGRVESVRVRESPRRRRHSPARSSSEIGPMPGRPPWHVVVTDPSWFRRRVPVGRVGKAGSAVGGRGALDGEIEAGKGLSEPPGSSERAPKAREISGRRSRPGLGSREPGIEVRHQAREGPHVLVVVADHREQHRRVPVSQELQVAGGDLPARYVLVPGQAEKHRLRGLEPGVRHAVAVEAPDDREQVEVPEVGGRIGPRHAIPSDQERPVEPAAVVGHEPAVGRDVAPELLEEGGLVRVVRQQELYLAEPRTLPPADADEEGERARGGGESRRLRVEAEERRVRGRLPGQPGEPLAIDRHDRRPPLDPDERSRCRPDELPVHLGRQAFGADRGCPGPVEVGDGGACAGRRPEVREPALERDGHRGLRRPGTPAGQPARHRPTPAPRAGGGRAPSRRPRDPGADPCRPGSRSRRGTRRRDPPPPR
jgi:hypothetical protein